jgi:hypothetical protein
VDGARGRFIGNEKPATSNGSSEKFYKLARPGLLWNGNDDVPLPQNGGKARLPKQLKPVAHNVPVNGAKSNTEKSESAEAKVTRGLQDQLW